MANHKSAVKRHKQSIKRRDRNIAVKSAVKTAVKRVEGAISKNDIDDAKRRLRETNILLDKAVSKGVLHRNNASRKISRLTTKVNVAGS